MNIRVGQGASEAQAFSLACEWARESGKYVFLMELRPGRHVVGFVLTDTDGEDLHQRGYEYVTCVPGKVTNILWGHISKQGS